ncbi:DegT/DnrJ/EryC1/StrS family aminotransferase [Nitratidesulfovibrio sp.]|uniref:DegT/DnrJ/EryC1/StrS family aminotransferase n=1 Tax=Nitratidesulfovibrio sp. TaxID=2802297 RepID=UPI003340BDCE
MRTGRGRGGDACEAFGRALRETFGMRHAFLHCTGRAALSAAFRAMRALAPTRDEVLLPAYTSYSVAAAAVHAGMRVALYDLEPDTLAPSHDSVAAAMGERTLCVVACHLFGYPVDIAALRILCQQHGAWLLDDAAQAMGASIGGRHAGTCGDVGLFSLARGKNITAVDGGVLITGSDELARQLAQDAPYAVSHAITDNASPDNASPDNVPPDDARGGVVARGAGETFCRVDAVLAAKAVVLWVCQHPRAYWLPASLPFLHIGASRLEPRFASGGLRPLQAAMALRALGRLDAVNAGRRAMAHRIVQRLRDVCGLRTVAAQPGADPVFTRLPLLPGAEGWTGGGPPQMGALGMVRSYPQSLRDLAALSPHRVAGQDCPVARWVAASLITLPTHAFVEQRDMDAMVGILVRATTKGPGGRLPVAQSAAFPGPPATSGPAGPAASTAIGGGGAR